jgi:hypothetical protein
VDVLIRLERQEPPAGTMLRLREEERLASEAEEALSFVGWLGLLRALSEVVREAGEPAAG